MVTTASRRVSLLRLLSLLLLVLLALFAAPAAPAPSGSPSAGAEVAAADRALVLAPQAAAGVRGSRAPPVASA